jgi:cold shock CspA family protein
MNKVREGVVLRYGSRGFGFLVEPSSSIEYYFHISSVHDWRVLRAGDRVCFERDMNCPRPTAIKIELVESPHGPDRRPQCEQAPTPSAHAPSNRAASQQPSAAQPTSTEGGSR